MGKGISTKSGGRTIWSGTSLVVAITMLLCMCIGQEWIAPATADAAIAATQLTSASSNTGATSYTTASISPTGNNLVLAWVANYRSFGSASTPTMSGNGLAWTQVATLNVNGATTHRLTLFRAMGASPTTGSATISFGATSQTNVSWSIIQFSGVDTSGTNGSGAVVQNAINSATSTTSLTTTLVGFDSSLNATAAGFMVTATPVPTVEAGYTGWSASSTNTFLRSEFKAANDTTPSASTAAAHNWAGIGVELRIANDLTIGNGTNPGNASAYQNSIDNAINSFTMAMSTETSQVSALTLTSTNSASTNVSNIKIYRDAGTIGTYEEGTDTLIPTTLSGQSATAATLTFTTPEDVTTSAQNYLITYDMAGGATVGNTMTARVTAATGSVGTPTYSDSGSATLTVATGNLTVGNGTNPASANAYLNSTNNAIDAFALSVSVGTGKVSTLTLTSTNSATTNVSAIRVYRDAGTIGTYEDGTDTLVPTTISGQLSAGATITFTTPESVTTSTQNYLITYDIAGGATVGNTMTARVTAAAGTGLGTISYSDSGSATLTVATGNLTIGAGTNPANNASSYRGNPYGVDGFTLSVSAGVGQISTLTLTSTNSSTTNVSNIYVYRDNGVIGTFEPGIDTLVPSTASGRTSTAATLTLTNPETVTTTPTDYLIVYEIGNSATVGTTLTSRVTAATGTGLGTKTYNDSSSATLTVAQNNLTVGNGTNPSSASAYRGFTYAIDAFTLQMSAANSTATTLTLTTTNSAMTNVAAIYVYSDAGTIGTLDGSDTLIPSLVSGRTATTATITFATPEPVLSASAKTYLIVYKIADGATVGNTMTARVTGADGYVGVPTYSDTGSATLTIAQGTLTVGNGTNPANANVPQGSTNKAIDGFSLAMSVGASGKVSTLTLTNTNSAATNVSNITIYSDGGTVGTLDGSDTVVPSTYTITSATAATIEFETPETITSVAKNYLIVYDIANGATIGNTLSSRVTAVTGVGLGTPTYSDAGSATLTVTAGICTRSAPSVTVDTGSALTYGYTREGASKVYTLTVSNKDNLFCSDSTFTLGIGSETGTTGSFNLPSILGVTSTGPLSWGTSYSTTFTVSAKSTGVIPDNITSTINVTDAANHAAQPGSAVVKTYVNDPMMHNSITTGSAKWSGSWGITGGQYGAFDCTTCHVPKSTNIARVKTTVAAPGGAVVFQSKNSTNSFATYSAATSSSQRICETCHTATTYHRGTLASIVSHENEAQARDCSVCHSHKKGFKPIGGCTKCHAYPQRNRVAVFGQFTAGNSHHIQGVTVTDTLCYQCHWEANSDGTVNLTYHGGSKNTAYPVDLVITKGSRPTVFKNLSSAVQYTANGTRTQIGSINNHCLGCHSDSGNALQPFGDGNTPKQYAWDGTSVNARYSQAGKTAWGKFASSSNNVTPKDTVTKAFSAHGKADKNSRGFGHDVAGATTEDWGNNSGDVSVACYDCHNSHGSSAGRAANVRTSNYSSATGRYKGALLKETIAGKGGYTVSYKPIGGTGTNLAYEPGATLCFDCHNSAAAGTALSRSAGYSAPWGYSGTYGSTKAIAGYWDTPYFDSGTFPATVRYSYKGGNGSNKGGHFGKSSPMNTTPMGQINGLCTPCHDPHGVSPTIANQTYAVPLLKGTWVTSPYREDTAPLAVNEQRGGSRSHSPSSPAYSAASTPGYNLDQNTFQPGSTYWAFSAASGLQTLADTQFAGLCIQCHPKADIGPGTSANTSATWKTMDRVHNTVQGWGSIGGNNTNQAHAYTCSKCHAPHNTRLPRLLVTNCLDFKHRGQVASGATFGAWSDSGSRGSGGGRGPMGGGGDGNDPQASTQGPWFFSKNSPPAQNQTSNIRTCHNVSTAGGAGTTDSFQLWNTKTPW
ncbi:hypothetical protein KI811_09870 [Geobacter hydrogenophilus]|uniref:Uncharacterized protein n=1 Tax=Geobacter hydrogenophilus TaxID=40983 RepID=A0A9W6G1A9_9BACT|nr:cytochrome c3 family protein [Geobacter hydrogenophilus]MBT0894115.1 hypothetical protein [Geobacter hydrogenophilus]GLI38602.1 hypothetical protein GHYDROH2_21030 [Geobacter hydrogenophilus]